MRFGREQLDHRGVAAAAARRLAARRGEALDPREVALLLGGGEARQRQATDPRGVAVQHPHGAVAVVAAEELVAAVAAERHLDVRPRLAREPVLRQQRAVGGGLPAGPHQPVEVVHRVVDAAVQGGVLGAQVGGDGGGVLALVVAGGGHRDAEGPQRAGAGGRQLLVGDRGDERGIDATGEEAAQRDVGLQATRHRLADDLAQALEQPDLGAGLGQRRRPPVLDRLDRAVRPDQAAPCSAAAPPRPRPSPARRCSRSGGRSAATRC